MSVADDARAANDPSVYDHGFIRGYFYRVDSYTEQMSHVGSLPSYIGTASGFHPIDGQPGGSYNAVTGPGTFVGVGTNQLYDAHGTSAGGEVLFFTLAGTDANGAPNTQLFALSSSATIPTNATIAYNSDNPTWCLTEGTLIATPRGLVPVEELELGEQVITASGVRRTVVWLGHQTMHCALSRRPEKVMPITFERDAIAPGVPDRALRLSPGHGVALFCGDEVLVQASALVNGATIRQDRTAAVVYWHVELDQHDLLLAHNMPVESFLDVGNRQSFGGAELTALTLVEPAGNDPAGCRPRLGWGSVAAALRERLAERARALGWTLAEVSPDIRLMRGDASVPAVVSGGVVRSIFPDGSQPLRLLSHAGRASVTNIANNDDRKLGMMVTAITIENAAIGRRQIDLASPALRQGFHEVEAGLRWTDGDARLPSELFDGCEGSIYLEIEFRSVCDRAWIRSDRAGERLLEAC